MKMQFTSYLNDIEKDLRKAEFTARKKAAAHVRKKMIEKIKTLFKKRTGNLLKGIRYEHEDKSTFVGVGRPASHAHLLELGTRERTVTSTGKSVGKITKKPFILPTFEEESQAVADILSEQWL
jgi:HK97 gp10 family phage protein